MKTPEEIKQGLECCLVADDDMCRCDECPYSKDGYNTLKCDIELGQDALELIIMLESAEDEWGMVAASPGAVEDMARENAQKDERIRQLERELATAMNTIQSRRSCIDCKHSKIIPDGNWVWTDCPKRDGRCCNKSLWEWRGVEEE